MKLRTANCKQKIDVFSWWHQCASIEFHGKTSLFANFDGSIEFDEQIVESEMQINTITPIVNIVIIKKYCKKINFAQMG